MSGQWRSTYLPGNPIPTDPEAIADLLAGLKLEYRLSEKQGWGFFEHGQLRRVQLEVRIREIEAKLYELVAAPAALAKSEPNNRNDKVTPHDSRLNLKMLIDALAKFELWGVTRKAIARRTRIPYQTLCRYLNHPDVVKTWKKYERESAGKTPAKLEELGGDPRFSFSI
jgi:hypothetical protein